MAIDRAYRALFAAKLEAVDKVLADRVEDDIKRLTALLAVNELRSVDADSLRKVSETLVVGLQAAAPELGLSAPALEEAAK